MTIDPMSRIQTINLIKDAQRSLKATNHPSFESVMRDKGDAVNTVDASQISDSQTVSGKPLGAWIFMEEGGISVGYNIVYAEDSTPTNPIVCLEDGSHRVEIQSVDPNHASDFEMRMTCAYLDHNGLGNDDPMGTYNQLGLLRIYEHTKAGQGASLGRGSLGIHENQRYDWLKISDEYLDVLDKYDKAQYLEQKKLNEILSAFFK